MKTITTTQEKLLTSVLAYETAYKILLSYINQGEFSVKIRNYKDSLISSMNEMNSLVKPILGGSIDKLSQYIIENDKNWKLLVLPVIINLSFAIELSIKTLHSFNEKTVGTDHNLKKLFEILPQEQKNNIKIFVCESNFKISERVFKEYLKRNSNHFERWRYFYEEDITDRYKPNINFLEAFLQAVKFEILKLLP